MRIDAAGHHQQSAGVDDLGAGGRFQIGSDRGDFIALAQHVGPPAAIGGDDGSAADEKRHGLFLRHAARRPQPLSMSAVTVAVAVANSVSLTSEVPSVARICTSKSA